MSNKLQVAGFVSASGSTAAAVYLACQKGQVNADMPLVIANHPKAGDKLRALDHPPRIVVISRRDFESRSAFGEAIIKQLDRHGIGFAGMYGWDPVMPDNVLARLPGAIVNQHPDMPPWFGGIGMNGIIPVCARLNFAAAVGHSAIVEPVAHFATSVVDGGAVVTKGCVEILSNDTCESLYERVKEEERKVQIATVSMAAGQILHVAEIISPVEEGEEEILKFSKLLAFKHHAGATQSALKRTKR
jgi:phosphoribosylglycinamide formyltransferase-1